jgi:folate-dependent phosphoribosylglycinamide formyltransferase PurN
MKLVVITNGNFFARVELTRLFQERHKDIAGVVVITGIKARKSRLRSLMEIWQQSGWRYFLYKSSTYLVFAAARLLYRGHVFFVPGLAKRFSIPVVYAAQVNSPYVVSQVEEWKPDLLISVSCPQRIQRELLSIPTVCAINIHASLLPAYAGIAPNVWVLANGETLTGTTVHVMKERFDTGHIIIQKQMNVAKNETAFSLFFRLNKLGSDALAEAVAKIVQGNASLTPQDTSKATYYSWPKTDTIRGLFRRGHRLCAVSDYRQAIRCVE